MAQRVCDLCLMRIKSGELCTNCQDFYSSLESQETYMRESNRLEAFASILEARAFILKHELETIK